MGKSGKNPIKMVQGLVNGVRQWIDNAEKEDQEYRMELVNARPPDPMNPEGFTPPPTDAPPPRQKTPTPVPQDMAGRDRNRTPHPQGSPLLGSGGGSSDYSPTAPHNPAGMRYSKEIRRDGTEERKGGGVRISRPEDTSYHERNKTVALVKERYAPFGHSIASAMLTRCLSPRGIAMLLERLELPCTGTEEGDHDLILEWVNDKGAEEFAKALGLNVTPAKIHEEQRNHVARTDQKKRLVEEARARSGGTSAPSARKRMAPANDEVRNSSPFTQKTGIKPIALPPAEPPPLAD